MKIKNIFILCVVTSFTWSCTYNKEEELYPSNDCAETYSYQNEVVKIIEGNCYSCHSKAANLGDVTLEGYENIKKYVDDESLLGSLKEKSGYSQMPKNGDPLSACSISIIENWINEGAKNN